MSHIVGPSLVTRAPQCIMEYTHHVYSLHSSHSGPRKYCLGTTEGTSDCWRLDHHIVIITHCDQPHVVTASAPGPGAWSLAITGHGVTGPHEWGPSPSLSCRKFLHEYLCFIPMEGWCWHRGWCEGTGLVFTPHGKAQARPCLTLHYRKPGWHFPHVL